MAQTQLFIDDGNENVNANGNPDLSLDGVGRGPEEGLIRKCCLIHLKKSSISAVMV